MNLVLSSVWDEIVNKFGAIFAGIVAIERPWQRIATFSPRCIVITRSDGVAHGNSCLAGFEDDIGTAIKLAAPLREIIGFFFAIKEISVSFTWVAYRVTC